MKRMGSPVSALILLMCNLTILFIFHTTWGDTQIVIQYVVEGMLLISILISVIVMIMSLGNMRSNKSDGIKEEEMTGYERENGMLFNIYYMNFAKAYEIKMIISNIIHTSSNVESDNKETTESELRTSIAANFPKFLNAGIGSNTNSISSDSQKVIEAFEIKTTKSVVLNDVIEKSTMISNLDDAQEGQLLRVDNVKLQLMNETELRTVKMLTGGAFKGAKFLQVEGMDLSNAFNSVLKDYAYKIKGKTLADESLLMKIPMTFENEFESLYSIDDLFIGNVTLIGIYKGKIKIGKLKNTFEFLQEIGTGNIASQATEPDIHSSQTPIVPTTTVSTICEDDDSEYNYIDLLAIVQKIESIDGCHTVKQNPIKG